MCHRRHRLPPPETPWAGSSSDGELEEVRGVSGGRRSLRLQTLQLCLGVPTTPSRPRTVWVAQPWLKALQKTTPFLTERVL